MDFAVRSDESRSDHSRAHPTRCCVFFSFSPFLRGEGRDEGLSPRTVLLERAPHPPVFAEPVIGRAFARPGGFAGRPLPASAFARTRASADKRAGRGDFKRFALGCLPSASTQDIFRAGSRTGLKVGTLPKSPASQSSRSWAWCRAKSPAKGSRGNGRDILGGNFASSAL